MAYFANSSEGDILNRQCEKCEYGQMECPIAHAQTIYNYEVVGNQTATNILNILVNTKGQCKMYEIIRNVREENDFYGFSRGKEIE